MTPPGAVVVGGDYRGLGITRSLGRRGVPVWVVHSEDDLARRSRYCRRAIRCDTLAEPAVIDVLLRLAADEQVDGWVLYPTTDETAWMFSRFRDELAASFRHTVPTWEVFAAAADKRVAAGVATGLGLATPRSWFPRTVEEFAILSFAPQDFPLVVKPARRERLNRLTTNKAWRADNPAQLRRRYADASAMLPPDEIMIQELISGDGEHQYAFGAVCAAGEPRETVSVRRTRQYPREFGRASCFVETIDYPELAKDATRLIAELELSGLVEVEFKYDTSSASLKLLDVNPRVWGWHSIDSAAGVDFSFAAYRLALGKTLPIRTGRPGVRWSRLSMDLAYAVPDLVAGRMGVLELARSLRSPLAGPIAARDDPIPALMELPSLVRLRHRRRRAGTPARG